MNDTLFSLPEVQPSTLEAARVRFAAAREHYDKADQTEDDFGDPIPDNIRRDLRNASRALLLEEDSEVRRRKGAEAQP